jgi:hypothetical protein
VGKLKSGNPVFYPTALVHFDAPIHTPTTTHTHTHSHPTKPNSSSPRPRAIALHRWQRCHGATCRVRQNVFKDSPFCIDDKLPDTNTVR